MTPITCICDAQGVPCQQVSRYRGCPAFLVCGGPSLASMDLGLLQRPGVMSMAVNNALALVRTDMMIFADGPGQFLASGFLDPRVRVFAPRSSADSAISDSRTKLPMPIKVRDCPNIDYYQVESPFRPETFLTSGKVPWGDADKAQGFRSTMACAIRVLYDLGFRTVFLLGCDFRMKRDRPYAFSQEYEERLIRHNNNMYQTWTRRFTELQPYFLRAGFSIFNCTPGSALTVFPQTTLEEAVDSCRLLVPPEEEKTEGMYARKPKDEKQ